jgi:ferredoxin--NADP+ reductase
MDYKLLQKRVLALDIIEYVFYAPAVVRNARSGQFVMLRIDEKGERVPFTIVDADRSTGELCLLVQTVGYTTARLARLNVGDFVSDIVGPLGAPTDLDGFNNVCLIAGGIGAAVVFPQSKHLFTIGKPSDVVLGARTKELIIFENQFKKYAKSFTLTTNDGSAGMKGFVTDALKSRIESGADYDAVFAVGPVPMMRAVCEETKKYGLKTIVSMSSVMVDGTGMCGSCRVSVEGVTRYACVDGPEFDGHKVDWNEAANRAEMYRETEREQMCKLKSEK